jgi:Fe-S-cluster formation regulator IscX/YfhJ
MAKFKKRLALLAAAAVIASAVLIPQVRAAAVSALSIFRVADTKTIRITVNDLQNMMTFLDQQDDAQDPDTSGDGGKLPGLIERAESGTRQLTGVDEFTDFPFSLPTALKDETPALYAVGSQAQAVTIDTDKINAALSELGAAVPLAGSLDGAVVTVSTPPAVVAEYPNVTLLATQTVSIDDPAGVMDGIKASLLSTQAISDDLRAQLQAIDPMTRDIYLPVVEGLGRETGLGGTTGYLYTTADLAQVIGNLPGFDDDAHLEQLQNANATALIWTKDGVLYCLAGQLSDSELTRIARSIG